VNPAFVVADEVHRWKTRKQIENWDVLSKAGSRAADTDDCHHYGGRADESPLAWKLHEKTRRIEEGSSRTIGSTARSTAPRRRTIRQIRRPGARPTVAAAAQRQRRGRRRLHHRGQDPQGVRERGVGGDLTSFKRYFLNIWDQKENRALEIAKWDASAGDWKTPACFRSCRRTRSGRSPHDFMARFFQRTCWAGVDLSMTTDLTSVVFLFPGDDDSYDVLPFFWVPEARVRKLELNLGVPLSQWIRDGFLEATPRGDRLPLRAGPAGVGLADVRLQEICWDPWNSRQVSVAMVDDGYKCAEIRQGYIACRNRRRRSWQPSLKESCITAAILFCAGMRVARDCGAQRQPDVREAEREKSTSRIDGISAITTRWRARCSASKTSTPAL